MKSRSTAVTEQRVRTRRRREGQATCSPTLDQPKSKELSQEWYLDQIQEVLGLLKTPRAILLPCPSAWTMETVLRTCKRWLFLSCLESSSYNNMAIEWASLDSQETSTGSRFCRIGSVKSSWTTSTCFLAIETRWMTCSESSSSSIQRTHWDLP